MDSKKKTYAPVKPARSYEEQARRLMEVHNLEIGDTDKARRVLSSVNYYRLTTYGKHLRRSDDPERFIRFCPCSSFSRGSCAPECPIIWR